MGLDELKRFILDGSYLELRQAENRLQFLKYQIREEQESLGLKRILWAESGVVGEFETYKIYEYNYEKLIAYLHNVGILPLVTFIKSEDLSEEELEKIAHISYQRKRYLRFTPSNNFKRKENTTTFEVNLENISLLDKVSTWKENHNKFEQLNAIWKCEKLRALLAPEFRKSKELSFESGTFSLIEAQKIYRTDLIHGLLDEKTICSRVKVNFERIDEFIAKGFLKKFELSSVRKIVDTQRRYILMTLQKEKAKKEYWYSKLEKLSILSQRSADGWESLY